jgi:hypothetical protein
MHTQQELVKLDDHMDKKAICRSETTQLKFYNDANYAVGATPLSLSLSLAWSLSGRWLPCIYIGCIYIACGLFSLSERGREGEREESACISRGGGSEVSACVFGLEDGGSGSKKWLNLNL